MTETQARLLLTDPSTSVCATSADACDTKARTPILGRLSSVRGPFAPLTKPLGEEPLQTREASDGQDSPRGSLAAQGVALLDRNGRLWLPNLMLGGGEPNDGYCDLTVGAMALDIDGQGTPWVLNSEGRIYFEPPQAGMGASRQWQEHSLKEDGLHLVKATQIAAGLNRVIAVDDQKSLCQCLPGKIYWSLDA
jgi:hypothetical protein